MYPNHNRGGTVYVITARPNCLFTQQAEQGWLSIFFPSGFGQHNARPPSLNHQRWLGILLLTDLPNYNIFQKMKAVTKTDLALLFFFITLWSLFNVMTRMTFDVYQRSIWHLRQRIHVVKIASCNIQLGPGHICIISKIPSIACLWFNRLHCILILEKVLILSQYFFIRLVLSLCAL